MVASFNVTGKSSDEVSSLKRNISSLGFPIMNNPDFVISLGGDGSILFSERSFPGVPKIPIRDRSICRKCNSDELHDLLRNVEREEYRLERFRKLQVSFRDRLLTASNDVVIRNARCFEALRFEVFRGNRKVGWFVGDGVVVSSVFGSSAYFYSVCRRSFDATSGVIGLAFNNTVEMHSPIIGASALRIRVIRNLAHLCVDNIPRLHKLGEGDVVYVKQARDFLQIVRF